MWARATAGVRTRVRVHAPASDTIIHPVDCAVKRILASNNKQLVCNFWSPSQTARSIDVS
jgi:hypothetical protein